MAAAAPVAPAAAPVSPPRWAPDPSPDPSAVTSATAVAGGRRAGAAGARARVPGTGRRDPPAGACVAAVPAVGPVGRCRRPRRHAPVPCSSRGRRRRGGRRVRRRGRRLGGRQRTGGGERRAVAAGTAADAGDAAGSVAAGPARCPAGTTVRPSAAAASAAVGAGIGPATGSSARQSPPHRRRTWPGRREARRRHSLDGSGRRRDIGERRRRGHRCARDGVRPRPGRLDRSRPGRLWPAGPPITSAQNAEGSPCGERRPARCLRRPAAGRRRAPRLVRCRPAAVGGRGVGLRRRVGRAVGCPVTLAAPRPTAARHVGCPVAAGSARPAARSARSVARSACSAPGPPRRWPGRPPGSPGPAECCGARRRGRDPASGPRRARRPACRRTGTRRTSTRILARGRPRTQRRGRLDGEGPRSGHR